MSLGGASSVIHRVIITYFLGDDSIAVAEPEVPNSGLRQGPVLMRQRIPKDASAPLGKDFFILFLFHMIR
jgi:hypothetical protein